MYQEIQKGLVRMIRGISDIFAEADSNPAHIMSFLHHDSGCSRSLPLQVSLGGDFYLPSGGAMPPLGQVVQIVRCPECGGENQV